MAKMMPITLPFMNLAADRPGLVQVDLALHLILRSLSFITFPLASPLCPKGGGGILLDTDHDETILLSHFASNHFF
jgi:hypothetical protein